MNWKIVFILPLAFILTLGGCSDRPRDIRDGFYNAGSEAIHICDRYLDAEITIETAADEIEEVFLTVDKLFDVEDLTEAESDVWLCILIISKDMVESAIGGMLELIGDFDPYDKILAGRNELAELLGEEVRISARVAV